MANKSHMGNKKQSMEKEVKDLYVRFTLGAPTDATATISTTTPINLTANTPYVVPYDRNGNTFTIQVLAAAANPTDTVLANFTGTTAAIVCTITPNDGTNNGATPVDLTTAELVELINTGSVSGKTVTLTDASSLRTKQSATGGGAQNLADGGEGDGEVGTFAGGDSNTPTLDEGYSHGVASIERIDVGDIEITLEDKYASLKHVRGILMSSTPIDGRIQLGSETVSTTKIIKVYTLTGADLTDMPDGTKVLLQIDVKNTSQPW